MTKTRRDGTTRTFQVSFPFLHRSVTWLSRTLGRGRLKMIRLPFGANGLFLGGKLLGRVDLHVTFGKRSWLKSCTAYNWMTPKGFSKFVEGAGVCWKFRFQVSGFGIVLRELFRHSFVSLTYAIWNGTTNCSTIILRQQFDYMDSFERNPKQFS